jgi:hypothetical protein
MFRPDRRPGIGSNLLEMIIVYRVLPCVAVLGVVLIAGCGSSDDGAAAGAGGTGSASTAATRNAAAKDYWAQKESQLQNQLADCMKQHGFTYIAQSAAAPVAEADQKDGRMAFTGMRSLQQPDDKLRQWRSKYGFGDALALSVYPHDPQVKLSDRARSATRSNRTKDPNAAIVAALDPAQRAAYNKALVGDADGHGYDAKEGKSAKRKKNFDDSCSGQESAALSASLLAEESSAEAVAHRATQKKVKAQFKSDPEVAAAAGTYADCLKQRGYLLKDKNPLYFESDLTQKLLGTDDEAFNYSRSEAKQKLAQEIKIALDDLECRAPYAKLMRAKYPTVVSGVVDVGDGV